VQAKAMWASVEGVRAVDKSTVEIKLKEKSGIVLISLANANNFAAVYPKEIAEKYPTPAKVTEYIGTGPFKFVEWKPDVHIRMEGRLRRRDPVDPDAGGGHAGRQPRVGGGGLRR
jgi:ABC-type transport system substrate-binding protein